MNRRHTSAALGLLLAVLVAAGCSTLPTSGDVRTEPGTAADAADQAPYFVPPGPVAGADRAAVVRGFLLATQANPPSTSVARTFLAESARSTWKPAGAVVYATSSIEDRPERVVAHLSDAHRIDARGSWESADRSSAIDLDLDLVREQGEWRIQNPPPSLPVPTSYFRNTYLPYLLYYFDRTGSVLVPTRVYLPSGEQAASSLVRGLLAGPGRDRAATTVTAFGDDVDLDLSVVIGDDGVAEVPLSSGVQDLSRADLYRAVVQLSATLRQVPGVTRIRVTVGGVAIPLIDGQTDVGTDLPPALDPVATPDPDLVAIVGGRVLVDDENGSRPIAGPFGAEDAFGLRSIAVSAGQGLAAGVTGNGRRAFQAPTVGDRSASRATVVLDGATNLLRPVYDRFGNLWLVDAPRSGAVVRVVTGGRVRVVQVPGISGQRIAAFTVTRDGASVVAGLAGGSTPTLAVSQVQRSQTGRPVRGLAAERVRVPDVDLATIVDVGQNSPTGVVVLTRSSAPGGRLFTAELDGSPGVSRATDIPAVPGEVVALIAGPDGRHPTQVLVTDGRLLRQGAPIGEWVQTLPGVRGAAYPQ